MGPFPRGPLTSAQLLPFGATFEFETGRRHVLERMESPSVVLSKGSVSFSDPAFLRYETPRVVATLRPGEHPVLVGVFSFPAPGKPGERLRRAAVMALGDTTKVKRWRPIRIDGQPFFFGVDAGTGLVYDSAAYDTLVSTIEASDDEVFQTVIDEVVAPIRVPEEIAGLAFDCGMGDGAYPVYLGTDASGEPVAVAADLELHHHAKRVN